jgi:hypothetical protein
VVGGVVAVLLAATFPASASTVSWSVVPSPNPSPITQLNGVSCVSPTACMAVGITGPPANRTLAEVEHGTRWSVVATPSPGRGHRAQLNAVSCVSATVCTAVGFYVTARGSYKTLVESWNGTRWSVVPSPNPTPGIFVELYGVSCLSAIACTATGITADHRVRSDISLIETWNGTRWSVVPSPNHRKHDFLDGVSCVSPTACMAVGSTGVYSPITLIESWNGTNWSVLPSPHPGVESFLYHVSCLSATACIATGTENVHGIGNETLVESWNGTRWSLVPSPSPGAAWNNSLGAVSCVSVTNCTAVGSMGVGAGDVKTLIVSWNGTTLSVVPSPSIKTSLSQLDSVSCVSATACTAVGYRNNAKHDTQTLIETATASQ